MSSEALDIVTICFLDEMRMLQMQARSIDRLMDPALLANYRIVINDSRRDACVQFVETVIKPELDWLADRIKILLPKDFGVEVPEGGWKAQQALKLAAARAVETPHYLILDAKNHFVRKVTHADLFDGALPRARIYQTSGKRTQWLANGLSYFGLDPAQAQQLSGATVTPYLMVTRIVRDLVEAIEDMEKAPLIRYFSAENDEKKSSEFFLYYAYIVSRIGPYDSIYSCTLRAQATLFTQHPRTDEAFEKIMRSAEKGVCYAFGVHRRRMGALDKEQRKRIVKMWKKVGLIDGSEAEIFLTPYTPSNEIEPEELQSRLIIDPQSRSVRKNRRNLFVDCIRRLLRKF